MMYKYLPNPLPLADKNELIRHGMACLAARKDERMHALAAKARDEYTEALRERIGTEHELILKDSQP